MKSEGRGSHLHVRAALIDAEIDENVRPVKPNVNGSGVVFNYSAFQHINLIITMSLKAKHREETSSKRRRWGHSYCYHALLPINSGLNTSTCDGLMCFRGRGER